MESVEDDWQLAEDEHREADADLLYVTFDPEKIAESELIEAIQGQGFEARRDGNKSASRRR